MVPVKPIVLNASGKHRRPANPTKANREKNTTKSVWPKTECGNVNKPKGT